MLSWNKRFIFNVRVMIAYFLDCITELMCKDVSAGGVSTTDLVESIYKICEVYSGVRLFTYQEQFAKRIIRSVLDHDGAVITALFARQSGKTQTISVVMGGLMMVLPQLANLPMFANDKRLQMYKEGFWVGIFAPSKQQAQITFGRIRKFMQSKYAQAVMEDPDFRLMFTTSNGQTVSLSNGSHVTAISASDRSNIEGESFMFIICEEAQDISNFVIQKSIHPMGAFYNATKCKIGTATTYKGDFYEAIERNKKAYDNKESPIKNHFEYNYRVVQKYNPNYASHIRNEIRDLGEKSDAFRMSYNLEWIISRGMFVDVNELEKDCGENNLDRISSDKQANHCAGIDIGGGSAKGKNADSTIITIVEVDWNKPVLMDSRIDEETKEEIIYLAYNTYLKDWKEIGPEIAEDYEEQYAMIIEYLNQFRIARLYIDSTRESSLAQRIKANVTFEVVPFVFTSKSKSELYKHLHSEIKTGRARFANSDKTKNTREYIKFMEQFSALQKGYSGSLMVVSHPDLADAHDDYCDSWALAVYASKDEGIVNKTETQNKSDVFGNRKKQKSVFNTRNRVTARRR